MKKKETLNGINIERVTKSEQYKRKSFFKKTLKIIEYSYNVIKDSSKFSVIHCHDLDTLPIGVFIKWTQLGRKKIVYDAHEYETERHHIHGALKSISKIVERFFIRFADEVITVSNGIADEYKRLYKIEKPVLVLNCPVYRENSASKNIFRKKFGINKNTIIFLYQGGLAANRGIETTIETFKNLKDPNKVMVFMGYGALENLVKEAAHKNDNIFYHQAVSPDILLDYTSSADVGIFFCQNSCLSYYYCLPNKLFEYTMAGLPVIISNLHEIKKIVNTFENGIVIKETPKALTKTITEMTLSDIHKYKKNIDKIKSIYSWEQQEKVLLSLYKNL